MNPYFAILFVVLALIAGSRAADVATAWAIAPASCAGDDPR